MSVSEIREKGCPGQRSRRHRPICVAVGCCEYKSRAPSPVRPDLDTLEELWIGVMQGMIQACHTPGARKGFFTSRGCA